MTNSTAQSRMRQCPNCGTKIDYVRIALHRPFSCSSCRRQLILADSYLKRFQWFCRVFALVVALAVAYKLLGAGSLTDVRLWEVLLLLFVSGAAGLVLTVTFGSIFVKRIFPPTIEDLEESASSPVTSRCDSSVRHVIALLCYGLCHPPIVFLMFCGLEHDLRALFDLQVAGR